MERKKRVTLTLTWAYVKQVDDLTSNRSKYIDAVLGAHLENIDDRFEQKLEEEISSREIRLKQFRLERKRKQAEAIALQREAEKRLKQAIEEFDASDHKNRGADFVLELTYELIKKYKLPKEQGDKLNEHIGRVHYGIGDQGTNESMM